MGRGGVGEPRGGTDEAHDLARGVARALRHVLGDDLVAVYLHGSAALGGFLRERSDLDILALCRADLTDGQVALVPDALTPLPYPAGGLEFSLMTAAEAAAPTLPAPRFELHVIAGRSDGAGRVVDGRGRGGDSDLVLHLTVCRACGITLAGPPPGETIAAIPHEVVLPVAREEIAWARVHAPLEYLVLASARVWLFAAERRLASKIAAGEWALERWDDPAVLASALTLQRGGRAAIDPAAAERLATYAERVAS